VFFKLEKGKGCQIEEKKTLKVVTHKDMDCWIVNTTSILPRRSNEQQTLIELINIHLTWYMFLAICKGILGYFYRNGSGG